MKCLIFCLFITAYLAASEIAVVTLAVGEAYQDAVQLGIENKKAYCEKHGYDFFCGTEILDPERPIPWSKILFIKEILKNSSYRWIFWTDADSLIMNFDIPLESLIDDHYEPIRINF